MKLIDGLNLKGCPAEIPDCSRNDLPELFKQLGFKVGAEIGVFMGQYTEILAKAGLKVYGVDPWKIDADYGHPTGVDKINRRHKFAMEKLLAYPNVTLIEETSMEAVKQFEDNSLDFVYIDGNHKFKYIAEDLFEWTKKVKPGGIISGHDYAYFKSHSPCGGCQVHEVLDAWVKSYHIENFWILGRRRSRPGEVRDDYRSWMFINDGVWKDQ
jgi:hypothetical protein